MNPLSQNSQNYSNCAQSIFIPHHAIEEGPNHLERDFKLFYDKIRGNKKFQPIFNNNLYSEDQFSLFNTNKMYSFLTAVNENLHNHNTDIEDVSTSTFNAGYNFCVNLESVLPMTEGPNLSNTINNFLSSLIKTASTELDIYSALTHFQNRPPMEWKNSATLIPNTLLFYKPNGSYTEPKKQELIAQADRDLRRDRNAFYWIDGKRFHKGHDLLDHLINRWGEETALDLLAFLQQGAKFELLQDIRNAFFSFKSGLEVQNLNPSTNDSSIVSTVKIKDQIIEIEQLFTLKAIDETLLTFQKEPHAIIKGFIKINYELNTAQFRWEVKDVNHGFEIVQLSQESDVSTFEDFIIL